MDKDNCLFCGIANGSIESATVFENNEFRVILDKFPASKGHTLVIPKEHSDDVYDIDGMSAGKIFAMATIVAKALKRVLKCDGINIIQNNGEVAGQTINHFHIHIIPRYADDDLDLTWPTHEFTDGLLSELAEIVKKEI